MKIVGIMICVLLCGCTFIRQVSRENCEELTLNTQAVREYAQCVIDSWQVNGAIFRALIGDRISELPVETVDAMDELDRLSELPELTNRELGTVIGLKLRLASEVVRKILEQFAPGALRYIPI